MVGYRVSSRSRRAVATFISFMVFAAVVAVVPTRATPAAAASPFDDVPEGAFYTEAVTWLADTGITTGTSPTTFSPGANVTRGQMAAFLERYAQALDPGGDHPFADVPPGAFYERSVVFLVDRGITTGTSPTTYSPGGNVTRAQMAAFLWRFSGEPEPAAPSGFADVPDGVFYTDAVAWLAEEGITTGTSATTYSPNANVTRAQMATFLFRLAGEPELGDPGLNRRDEDTTDIVDDDDVDFETLDVEGTSQIEYEDEGEVPDVGDVLALDVTPETPDGFLGRVVDVDGTTVLTQPATLTEAIAKADFGQTVDLEEDAVEDAELSLQAKLDDALSSARVECDAEAEVWIEASLNLVPSMTLEASWGLIDGVYFRAGLELEITPELRGYAGGEVNCSTTVTVDGPKLKPVTFFVGGFPVVIRPSLSFEVELYAGFKAEASPYVRYTETVGVEFTYEDKAWSVDYPVDDPSIGACRDGDGDPTEITEEFAGLCFGVDYAGEATVGVELRARLDLLAYGVVGIYLTIGPFLEFTVQLDDPWWGLYGGIRARAGIAVNFFDIWEDDWEFGQVDLYRKAIAQASSNEDPPPGFVEYSTMKTREVSAGDRHTCAISAEDQIACWGLNASYQLGLGDPVSEAVAEWVDPISTASPVDISAGYSHSCAVFSDGTIECWGSAGDGEIGDGSNDGFARTPQRVSGITTARQVEAGNDITCARLVDFTVWCWGDGDQYATGTGSTADQLTPRKVEGLGPVIDLSVSNNHVCVVIADGSVWCWGNNAAGQSDWTVNPGDPVTEPRKVEGFGDAVAVYAGERRTCVVHGDDRALTCWGRNHRGQLGIGVNVPSTVRTPIPVPVLYPVVDLAMGGDHTCAVLQRTVEDTQSFCWGYNFHDQTAVDGSPTEVFAPNRVEDQKEHLTITAGGAHSCAQTDGGRTECWGLDFDGQLGNDETIANRSTPDFVAMPYEVE